MTPAGYLYKLIAERPEHLTSGEIRDIYSVSNCLSKDFADYIQYWQHNGYWLFDTPAIMTSLASTEGISLDSMKLFYYEIYDREWDEEAEQWMNFAPELSFQTNVQNPQDRSLEGYDIVSYFAQSAPECSPLSCNSLANTIAVNQHCLFDNFESAQQALENGHLIKAEPGPYRILSVYSIDT